MPTYALGSWGVGNIGDDVILSGMKQTLGPKFRPLRSWSTGDHELMSYREALPKLRSRDTFLYGGGGLIHSQSSLVEFTLPLLSQAKASGCRLVASRIGLEGPADRTPEAMTELLGLFDEITVRSPWSVECAASYGFAATLVPDWATEVLLPAVQAAPERPGEIVLVIPRLDAPGGQERLLAAVGEASATGLPVIVQSHVARHLLDDTISERKLMPDLMPAAIGTAYPEDWECALELTMIAAKVWTDRYHGSVFAECCGVPWVAMSDDPKIAADNVVVG